MQQLHVEDGTGSSEGETEKANGSQYEKMGTGSSKENCRKLEPQEIAMGEASVFFWVWVLLVVTGCIVGSGNNSGWNWLPWAAKTGVSKAMRPSATVANMINSLPWNWQKHPCLYKAYW